MEVDQGHGRVGIMQAEVVAEKDQGVVFAAGIGEGLQSPLGDVVQSPTATALCSSR
jgi:hypothetical protein